MMIFIYIAVLGIAGVTAPLVAWLRVRRLRARAVLQTVASIVSQNLPLHTALRAAADAERGRMRVIYRRLADLINQGNEVAVALRRAAPGLPGEALGTIQAAELGGTLAAALQLVARDARREIREPVAAAPPLWYPLISLILAPGVVIFLQHRVLPRFVDIFADFSLPLPKITQQLLNLAGVPLAVELIAAAVMLLGLSLLGTIILRQFLERVPERTQPVFALVDTLAWGLPLVRDMANHRALARQLPLLETAVRAGHDLSHGAAIASGVPVNHWARRRMLDWQQELVAGQDPAASARALGFPAPVVRALAAGRTGGELALRLNYLAEYYDRLRLHWGRMLRGIVVPATVLLWGLCVLWIMLAVFLPLIEITDSMVRLAGY
jgi:type II secretory pathway component PulF